MRQMNVNDPDSLTEANVAALLASKGDSQHRQLRVMEDGLVVLSDDTGNMNLDGVRARWVTWCQGCSYFGPAAAKDKKWVAGVLHDLQQVVPMNLRGFIEDKGGELNEAPPVRRGPEDDGPALLMRAIRNSQAG